MSDYISDMRKKIGHAPLMCTGCGVIIENEKGQILLQERTDNGKWGLPGGTMNIGEKFVETAVREVYEETGLTVGHLSLFGIYSGKDRIIECPNRDICCVTDIVFITRNFQGELKQSTPEAKRNMFFHKDSLPEPLHDFDRKLIEQWKSGTQPVIVD
jgi:ADP-ribose pyrophosphatase YjhB (NUDIX family)